MLSLDKLLLKGLCFPLWNIVRKAEIRISANSLTIMQHKKLFSKPRSIDFDLIKKVFLEDLTIERSMLNIRLHPFSKTNFAIKIEKEMSLFVQ